jgi:ribosomal protein S12 methylthiotransferase accessory factor
MTMALEVAQLDLFAEQAPAAAFRRLLGWRTGLVKDVFLGAVEPNDPELFHVSVLHANIERMMGAPYKASLRAAGSGLTMADAMHRALGEVVERYACHFHNREEVVYDTYAGMVGQGLNALGPEQLKIFAPEQFTGTFPYQPFTEQTFLGWSRGTNLITGQEVWVPGQLVHFAYPRRKDEGFIGYPTSSGVAAASTLEEALLKGLFEQIERDAVMLTWFCKLKPPRLEFTGMASVEDLMYRRGYSRPGREFQLRYITTDLPVPTFHGIAHLLVGGKPRIFVGGAANLSAERAAFKALLEVGQGVPFIKNIIVSNPWPSAGTVMDNFDDNLRHYADPANMHHLSFITESTQVVDTRAVEPGLAVGQTRHDLCTTLRICKEHRLTPIAFDHTTGDMAELGFQVGRVFVPELAQLGLPSYPTLGPDRLYEVPERLGLTSKRLTFQQLNPLPHPYP